jgi:hypothetical protein
MMVLAMRRRPLCAVVDGICVQWPDDTYRCGVPPEDGEPPAECVDLGGTCTTQGDCCDNLTCTPSGSDLICTVIVE